MPSRADWMDAGLREAYWAVLAGEGEPDDPEPEEDPDNGPPPGLDEGQLAALIAEAREATAEQAAAAGYAARAGTTAAMGAAAAMVMGRRGPEMPGSAGRFPGQYAGPAAGFASGRELDTAPGSAVLALFAEDAAGQGDRYAGACDDELLGVICAWDRVEAHASARKHAAVAELIRRRPAPGCAAQGPAQMPAAWGEFTAAELAPALGISRRAAEDVLGLAWELEVLLPGTKAAFAAGTVNAYKAGIIAWATQWLDPQEARAAEALVLGRAGSLTPGGLRAAATRAVMQVAPDKARRLREQAAKAARVERWAEGSGNAALAGRELPPAQVFAADQRVTWWAEQLKRAGLDGGMDQLRARAFLDILLGTDSRPGRAEDGTCRPKDGPGPPGEGGSGPAGPDDGVRAGAAPSAGPLGGVVPPGFAGRVTLTVPLATLLDLADRPGQIGGIGPIDPALAKDLASAAARTPRSTWCVTVTDADGHPIGHGCARPAPASQRHGPAARHKPGQTGGHDPPRGASGAGPPGQGGATGGPGFSFTPAAQAGPPGGYGTWRLGTGPPHSRT